MEMSEVKSQSLSNDIAVAPSDTEVAVTLENDQRSSSDNPHEHRELHFNGAEVVRDVVIGMSDGLTVPFALTAGLSNLQQSSIVVTAGLAEIVAGAISMGLGGWLAGRGEVEHYNNEKRREAWEVDNLLVRELEEIVEIFEPYGIDKQTLQPLLEKLSSDREKFVDFMMKFELGLEKPSVHRAWQSALTIGFSYFIGGLVPIFPYFFDPNAFTALYISIGVTVFALFMFGIFKSKFEGSNNILYGAIETTIIGSIAAAAAFGIAKLVVAYFPSN